MDPKLFQVPAKRQLSSSGWTNSEAIKRAKCATFDDDHNAPQYLVVHQVECTRHEDHGDSLWLDAPRLFAGDSRATAIHGKIQLHQDVFDEDFTLENPEISFVVVKTYDCGSYHDAQLARNAFRTVELPDNIAQRLLVAPLKAHLILLDKDGPEAEAEEEQILFKSNELKEAMKDVRSKYPQYFPEEDVFESLGAPYLGMYHVRPIMRKHILHMSSWLSIQQRALVACLMNYIESSRREEYQEADSQFAAGKVTRRHFSKFFAPDDVIVRMTSDGPIAHQVSRLAETAQVGLKLQCWNWHFNGRFYKRRDEWTVEWPSPEETVPVESFSVYPLKFDTNNVRERLHSRGAEFWSCRIRRLVECELITPGFESRGASNRFMIDLNAYRQMYPEKVEEHDNDADGIENDDMPPNEPFLLLLPALVRGFGFHDKKWVNLPVEQIRDVEWSSDTFDQRLVLKSSKKEIIKALVTVHTSRSKPQKSDIIAGKGNGLIILLHGGPGTGKTLTAESIAEYAQRPLYRVTCGDIGTDPESVEKYLESVLYICSIWQCVVLMDEGDVFLEERRPTDLQRNALVSVFLRTLEYLDGIMILTSNRVGTFDEAFKSRVQLAMHYPPLSEDDRCEVWRMFFRDMLEADERLKHEELRGKLDTLARYPLNGREIRNVINTARQLARYRKEVLAYVHIDQALEVATEFEEYITRTRGHTDDEYAKAEGFRA